MQDLQGLALSDFEKKGLVILGKVEVDKDGTENFVELENVTSFDIQSTITNLFLKTCAKSFSIELLNTNDRYSFFDTGKSEYDWIREGRKIRLYVGIQAKETVEEVTQEESYGETENLSTKEEVEDNYTNLAHCTGEYSFSTGVGLYTGRCCEGNDQKTSILFQNITIPKNAKITSAKIYLQGAYDHCSDGEIGRLKIQAEKADNPSAPTSVEDWQSIETTTAYETMRIDDGRWPSVYPQEYDYTDDFSSVVEEIVNREGWASGNNINIIFGPAEDCDNGEQLNISGYYAANPEAGGGATLEIEYQEYTPEVTEESEIDSDFYWSWIYGIIDKATTKYDAESETCSISGRDYIAYLSENYLKNLWWGKQRKYSIIADKEKYDMPSDCEGVYRAYKYNISTQEYDEMTLNSEFTYDWEKNQFVFLHPNVPYESEGSIWVWYFNSQTVENVVADLLIEAGLLTHSGKQSWLSGDLVTPTGKEVDRCWFEEGTTYMRAIELLAERVIYRFKVNVLGQPVFTQIPVLLTDTAKRLNHGEYIVRNIEERLDELYNHFYLEGEKRAMKKINLGVMSNEVEDITNNSATLVGTILADGETSAKHLNLFGGISIITSKGFKWKCEGEAEQEWQTFTPTMGLFEHEITNLNPDTRYQWLVWAKNSLGHYAESNWNTFTTEPEVVE